ncbi:hypothetical protein GCM10025867_31680 [Frondihabitans sucicola]|uniref:Uncharacterized protein n=1 Tax=Frondihabitans sucicola TaxID=1268041 RepID=A0ABN6Y498_9MICO|nr:hypothetical protein GCM10025867_31680 [Frondihabitans sucicola]
MTGVGDEDRHHAGVAEPDQLDVPDGGAGEGGVLDEGDLIGELREQPDRARENLVEIGGVAEERLDGRALRLAERTEIGHLIDEEPVPLVCRHAAGRGVRGGDELFFFEEGHVVADRRRGDAELVTLDDRLGADRLP